MNKQVVECCPNCSQPFAIVATQAKAVCRIPLFLACGHTVCEVCITNMVKFTEPIDCRVCSQSMEVNHEILQKNGIHHVFPINYYLYGKLAFRTKEPEPKEDESFLNLKALLQSLDKSKGQCHECKVPTSTMCKECKTVLCETCFKKSHSFGFIKHHVLSDIEPLLESNTCNIHQKDLEYYCQDCKKVICIDCFFFGGEQSCKNHNVIPIQEATKGVVEELNEIAPKVDEIFRRLTKTALDIGYLLKNSKISSNTSDYTKGKNKVQNNFSKLYSLMQKHEQEMLRELDKIEFALKLSLVDAKDMVAEGIKKTQTVMKKINVISKSQDSAKMNLFKLLEEAKAAINHPWFLTKDEVDPDKESIQIKINEEIWSMVSNFVSLEGNSDCSYKLRATNELGDNVDIPSAPQNPVFPPEMIKDIREMYKPRQPSVETKPETGQRPLKYRHGSNSSLNSSASGGSNKKQFQVEQFQSPLIQAVSPYAIANETIPRPLIAGSKEMVYISHIVNPHDFYVQRSSQQTIIKNMLREFRNASTAPKPSHSHAVEGKLYLVLNKTWNEWQRCRVMHVDKRNSSKPLYHVFCIDFGNTEIVTIDELRLLVPNWMSNPPLSIHCSLANCKPICNSWTTEDALLIQEIIDNKQAVMHVRRILNEGTFMMVVDCDIFTFQDGVNLAYALAFHDRAVILNHKLFYPPINTVMEKPKIFINNSDFKRGDVVDVKITHVDSPDRFFVRKVDVEETFENLCAQLNETYIITLKQGSVYNPEKGLACVVHLGNRGWWRALVSSLPGKQRVQLFLVDTGETVIAQWSALRYIAPTNTTLKALATEFHLTGITPPNKRWGSGSVTLLNSLKPREIQAHVEEETRRGAGCVGVTLYDVTDADNPLCINTEMVKLNLAITIGIFGFNKTQIVEEQFNTRTPLDKPKNIVNKPKKSIVTILKKNEPLPRKKIIADSLDAKDKGPIKIEVKFLFVQSPSLIYVSVLDQHKTFQEFFEKIQELYHKTDIPVKENLNIGDKCCVFYKKTNTWRRAVIIEILQDVVKVFYSDFGFVELVLKSAVKELLPELAKQGDAAIKCHLSGIMPAIGEEWPSLTKEFLQDLIDLYPRHYITKNGAIKDRSLPIEIWVYHIIQGDALEPNKAEWRCINKKIIEQGLAIPDKTEAANIESKKESDSEMMSFLNLTSSVEELLQIEPLPAEVVECAAVRYDLEDNMDKQPLKSGREIDDSSEPEDSSESNQNTKYVADWLPPQPITCKEFDGMPTYVDSNGMIYLYDLSDQPTLDLIRKALDVSFVGSKLKGHNTKWVPGQLCIARFYLDGLFYRGRVVDVNESDKYCIVNYVDFGNDEKCLFSDMINAIVLHQIPIVSRKCVLGRIKPKKNKWKRSTLDYIHKLVVENKCFVKVIGDVTDDGCLPIDLMYHNKEMWISDLLVDLDFASYVDGTQPIVTKFKNSSTKVTSVVQPTRAITPESDSDPDYILEEEDSQLNTSTETGDTFKEMQNLDWNKLIDAENETIFKSYPKHDLREFICSIEYINKLNLELSVEIDDQEQEKYEQLFKQFSDSSKEPPINGIYANKACMALFSADEQWYRAKILNYCQKTERVKVIYVDYGNTEIIDVCNVREIPDDWIKLPPRTMSATLYGVKINEECNMKAIAEEYVKTFADAGSVHAYVINEGINTTFVELKDQNGNLIYKNLIEKGILISHDVED